jgi:hypothetical protein
MTLSDALWTPLRLLSSRHVLLTLYITVAAAAAASLVGYAAVTTELESRTTQACKTFDY